MTVHKEEFFREVTLRICSSLDIKVAVQRAYECLRDYFPVDDVFLDILDPELGSIRRISNSRGEADAILPLPEGLWRWLESRQGPNIFETKKLPPEARVLSDIVELDGYSDLVLPLRIEKKMVGNLILRAKGEGTYTEEHGALLATVTEPVALALANALSHEEVVRYRDLLLDDNRFLTAELRQSPDDIIGGGTGLRNVMEMVRQVAPLSNTILILGETGTGKEVIATALHTLSPRREGPFIKVNCGAIPESLIDSELFGHEKGAFTGAVTEKRGRFERAEGGTLFLDEIGELPPAAQVRLLRVLQTREIERVGGTSPIRVDVRVIAATHRNLEQMVSENRFREDLWFRLNVFPIIIPPLRQRKDDIPAFARHLVAQKSRELGLAVPPPIAIGALRRLAEYHWPGNVRELQNQVERELICHRGGPLHFQGVGTPQEERRQRPAKESKEATATLREAMAAHIVAALEATGGKIHGPGGAAEMLGVNANTLRNRMNKLGIAYGRRRQG